jgi:hypothetical protein
MILGIFLVCLAVFTAAMLAIQWLLGFLASVSATSSVEFLFALGGMGAVAILVRHNKVGIVIAVAIGVFWSLLLLGAESATLTPTLTLAAAALYAAAAVTLMESFLRQRV